MAKVLIMEDDFDQASMLARILSGAGHDVAVSYNGDEAWALLCESPYDVLLTDMTVKSAPDSPKKAGGLSLIGKMRATAPEGTPDWMGDVRIVALSGAYVIADSMLKMASILGADVCLLKPASAEAILKAIEPDEAEAHPAGGL